MVSECSLKWEGGQKVWNFIRCHLSKAPWWVLCSWFAIDVRYKQSEDNVNGKYSKYFCSFLIVFDNFMGNFSVFFWATQTIRSLHEWCWKESFVCRCTYQTKYPNTVSNFLLVGGPHDDTIVLAITTLSQLLVLPLFSILLLNPLCCSSAGWLAFPWCVIIAVRALEDCAKGSSWKWSNVWLLNASLIFN